jgi:hypothetical protein
MTNSSALQKFVIPAKAGAQSVVVFEYTKDWVPAFAGMTNFLLLP